MLTLRGLLEQREAINQKIVKANLAARERAREEIWLLMDQYDIKFREIDAGLDQALKSRREHDKTRAAVSTMVKFASVRSGRYDPAPKYRHPETGHTWTGRGLQPVWVRSALAAGLTLEAMRIPAADPVDHSEPAEPTA